MTEIPVLNHDAVLAAVTPREAIDRVRQALLRHHEGDWVMPAKVYLESPPYGDFRAMPARGDGLALVKWVTSFPGNPPKGLPTVTGVICVSDATTGEPLLLLDARSVTALRTGAVAAVAAQALAKPDARTVGIVGCGLHGAWVARCMAAAGYGPGTCHDPSDEAARALAAELRWEPGTRERARRRRRLLRDPGRADRHRGGRPARRDSTSTCSAPTAPASPRRASTRSPRARCSATSGSRRRTAAS